MAFPSNIHSLESSIIASVKVIVQEVENISISKNQVLERAELQQQQAKRKGQGIIRDVEVDDNNGEDENRRVFSGSASLDTFKLVLKDENQVLVYAITTGHFPASVIPTNDSKIFSGSQLVLANIPLRRGVLMLSAANIVSVANPEITLDMSQRFQQQYLKRLESELSATRA